MAEVTLSVQAPPAKAALPPLGATHRFREVWIALGQFMLVLLAWLITRTWSYQPGTGLGYQLGLWGGIFMLVLLVYPLRKRVRMMRNWGNTRPWFVFHMTLGLCGPVLILAHTRFHFGSLNAAVALWSMLLVAGSGIVGRYIYVAVHSGLSGQRLGLEALQREAGLQGDAVHSKLAFAPEVALLLHGFEGLASPGQRNPVQAGLLFLSVGFKSAATARRANRLLDAAVARASAAQGWSEDRAMRRRHNGRLLIRLYLDSVTRVARFRTWVRLFSLWHVAHVPMVYALAVTTIAHVVAVHMY